MEDKNENLRRSTRLKERVIYSDNEDDYKTSLRNTRTSARKRNPRKISNFHDNGVNIHADKISEDDRVSRSRQRNDSVSDVDQVEEKKIMMSELKEELEHIVEKIHKPSELFYDEDVSGANIYKFQTPYKRNAMVQKALLSRTPTCSKSILSSKHKIPYVLAERIDAMSSFTPKLRKSARIQETRKRQVHFSSESESVSEGSEFVPSDSDESVSEIENEDKPLIENENNGNDTPKKRDRDLQKRKIQIPITPCRRVPRGRSRTNIAYRDYHLKTDEYFESQAGKALTSDHSLGQLKNPRLDEKKLQELLSEANHISNKHKESIRSLTENYKSMFSMWYHIMEEGFNVLLYGLGSKRHLINDFYKELILDHPTLVINGFFPSLTIKDILDCMITEILELESPTNLNECFNMIEDILNRNPDERFYLLIHNIDGTMLRSNKSQDILSRLAAIPNTRVLASVDLINAPLNWDNVKRARYNFCWWDATTLLPYEAETLYESSLLVQHSGALALSSLHNVFASLTTNAKSIYMILVKYQVENSKNNLYSGMAFKDLYRSSREVFLVSSDIALRAQLTEFIDHKLVKIKRNVDGAEYLIIPLDNSLLEKFINEQETI